MVPPILLSVKSSPTVMRGNTVSVSSLGKGQAIGVSLPLYLDQFYFVELMPD
jgi:hypothetical protein